MLEWHQKKIDEIFKELGASAHGFSAGEADELFLKYGPNELIEKKKKLFS